MDNSSQDSFPGKRRRTDEKVSVLLERWFFQALLVFSEQFRDIQEVTSLNLHCKTMYCCRMTSPSTSTTSGTLTTCTPSSRVDWSQEEKVSKGTDSQCFSQPRTRCTPIKIWKKFDTIWTNPELRCTEILGEFTKIQYIGAIWSSLKEEDYSSIKHDNTQSFSTNTLRSICIEKAVYINRDAASSSQGTRRLVATEEDQQHLNFPEESESTRRLLASGSSESKGREKNWPHIHHISTNYVPHMEKVFSILRQRCGLGPVDQMKILDVNTATWSIFLSAAQKAAVHLGTDFTENLRSTRNQPKKSLRQLFQLTQKLITDQTEISGITTIDWQKPMWRETTLLTDRAVQFATAKTYVFSNSVLCLGGISTEPVKAWESVWLNGLWKHFFFQELDRIDGEPMEFEWKISLRIHNVGHTAELNCEHEHFKGRIIFMSMYNDIHWWKRGNRENCIANAHRFTEYARRFTPGHWSFLAPGSEKSRRNGTELISGNLMDNGTKVLRIWCSTLPKADILFSVLPAHYKEESWKVNEKE